MSERFSNQPERQLHICPECLSNLIQPFSWTQNDDDTWRIVLDCPNCFYSYAGNFDEAEVIRMEDRVEEGFNALLGCLSKLTKENMEYELEALHETLEMDDIWPEDIVGRV